VKKKVFIPNGWTSKLGSAQHCDPDQASSHRLNPLVEDHQEKAEHQLTSNSEREPEGGTTGSYCREKESSR
jgi:hypothetical protein